MSDSIEAEGQYCAHNYHPLPVVLTCDEGDIARYETDRMGRPG